MLLVWFDFGLWWLLCFDVVLRYLFFIVGFNVCYFGCYCFVLLIDCLGAVIGVAIWLCLCLFRFVLNWIECCLAVRVVLWYCLLRSVLLVLIVVCLVRIFVCLDLIVLGCWFVICITGNSVVYIFVSEFSCFCYSWFGLVFVLLFDFDLLLVDRVCYFRCWFAGWLTSVLLIS